VFFATPHFGSAYAAMGWRLRYVPYAAPAPSLARLAPGVCVCVCARTYACVRVRECAHVSM